MEVADGDYAMREIGPNLSLRKTVGTEKGVIHFDAPREYWDEHLSYPQHLTIDLGVFSVPVWVVVKLLGLLDAKRPNLVKQASKQAAVTQAAIEAEKGETGEALPMAGTPTLP